MVPKSAIRPPRIFLRSLTRPSAVCRTITPVSSLEAATITLEPTKLEQAYAMILLATEGRLRLGETDETPTRAAKAWRELTSGYGVDIPSLFKVFDPPDGYDQMVALSGVPFVSLCEHHLLPFTGRAHVVYLPAGKVIGLSKIPRLIEAYARRLQQQERLTMEVALALEMHLDPLGVAVLLEGTHSCMCHRGVRSDGVMRTSVMRGAMRESAETRAEALSLIGLR